MRFFSSSKQSSNMDDQTPKSTCQTQSRPISVTQINFSLAWDVSHTWDKTAEPTDCSWERVRAYTFNHNEKDFIVYSANVCTCIKKMKSHFTHYGIISDSGGQFASSQFHAFSKQLAFWIPCFNATPLAGNWASWGSCKICQGAYSQGRESRQRPTSEGYDNYLAQRLLERQFKTLKPTKLELLARRASWNSSFSQALLVV